MSDKDHKIKDSKSGRPSLYKEEYADQAYNYCLLGATDKDLANFFDVTETTINNWKLDHHEFFESIKKGKEIADASTATRQIATARLLSKLNIQKRIETFISFL